MTFYNYSTCKKEPCYFGEKLSCLIESYNEGGGFFSHWFITSHNREVMICDNFELDSNNLPTKRYVVFNGVKTPLKDIPRKEI